MNTTHEHVWFWEVRGFWIFIITVIVISIFGFIFTRVAMRIVGNDDNKSSGFTICKKKQQSKKCN